MSVTGWLARMNSCLTARTDRGRRWRQLAGRVPPQLLPLLLLLVLLLAGPGLAQAAPLATGSNTALTAVGSSPAPFRDEDEPDSGAVMASPAGPSGPSAQGSPEGAVAAPRRPAGSDAALFEQALSASRSGRFAEALPLWDQLLARHPQDAAAWSNRGNVRLALGDAEGAIADQGRAMALDPEHPDPHLNRGTAEEENGRAHV